MALRVVFDLDEKDLSYFRAAIKRARDHADVHDEAAIVRKAAAMIEQIAVADAPDFVKLRVSKLERLIEMMQDAEWPMSAAERLNVLTALNYFSDPEDLIPDSIPVLGYIDDAIMIELVVKELRHDIEAFEDFCRFRAGEMARRRGDQTSMDDYLTHKRRSLQQRMRRRRRAQPRRMSGSSRPRFRLF